MYDKGHGKLQASFQLHLGESNQNKRKIRTKHLISQLVFVPSQSINKNKNVKILSVQNNNKAWIASMKNVVSLFLIISDYCRTHIKYNIAFSNLTIYGSCSPKSHLIIIQQKASKALEPKKFCFKVNKKKRFLSYRLNKFLQFSIASYTILFSIK